MKYPIRQPKFRVNLMHDIHGQGEFEDILRSWYRTPYKLWSQAKGPFGGVDCVRFICGVLDEVRGKKFIVPRVAGDAAMNDPEKAMTVRKLLMREYNFRLARDRQRDGYFELRPRDVIMAGSEHGTAGHALIVGATGYVYACDERQGVTRTGLDIGPGMWFHGVLEQN